MCEPTVRAWTQSCSGPGQPCTKHPYRQQLKRTSTPVQYWDTCCSITILSVLQVRHPSRTMSDQDHWRRSQDGISSPKVHSHLHLRLLRSSKWQPSSARREREPNPEGREPHTPKEVEQLHLGRQTGRRPVVPPFGRGLPAHEDNDEASLGIRDGSDSGTVATCARLPTSGVRTKSAARTPSRQRLRQRWSTASSQPLGEGRKLADPQAELDVFSCGAPVSPASQVIGSHPVGSGDLHDFTLEIHNRCQEAQMTYQAFDRLCHSSVWHLIGGTLRPSKLCDVWRSPSRPRSGGSRCRESHGTHTANGIKQS